MSWAGNVAPDRSGCLCSLGGKVGGGEGGRGVGGMVVLRGEDARRKAAISEGGAVCHAPRLAVRTMPGGAHLFAAAVAGTGPSCRIKLFYR